MAEVYYERIAEADVDPGIVRAANKALARARLILGLPPIRIQWVIPISKERYDVLDGIAGLRCGIKSLSNALAKRPDFSFKDSDVFKDADGGFLGLVHPFGLKATGGTRESVVMISAASPLDKIARIIGHELKHIADFRDRRITTASIWTPAGQKAAERAADAFGEELAKLESHE